MPSIHGSIIRSARSGRASMSFPVNALRRALVLAQKEHFDDDAVYDQILKSGTRS